MSLKRMGDDRKQKYPTWTYWFDLLRNSQNSHKKKSIRKVKARKENIHFELITERGDWKLSSSYLKWSCHWSQHWDLCHFSHSSVLEKDKIKLVTLEICNCFQDTKHSAFSNKSRHTEGMKRVKTARNERI